ncbi:hypothetical protein HD554DRAFT_624785 [Boletus coccyginus]|nr:hypothetical protein HD554DRAFT_624785 [Boletus coccyginus]
MAAYSGLLWHMFLNPCSDRFLLRPFGDPGYRIYGSWFRICTPLTSFYMHITLGIPRFAMFCRVCLSFNIGIILLTNGRDLSQMVNFNVLIGTVTARCSRNSLQNELFFGDCNIVWMLAGRSCPWLFAQQ